MTGVVVAANYKLIIFNTLVNRSMSLFVWGFFV